MSSVDEEVPDIFRLCKLGKLEDVIENIALVPSKTENMTTTLHVATMFKKIDICDVILQSGMVDVNAQDVYGQTALFIAAEHGYLRICELLLDRGATMEIEDVNGDTPIHIACACKRFDVFELFMQKGANICTKNKSRRNLFHTAANTKQLNVIEKLLLEKKSVGLNDVDFAGETPLLIAVKRKMDVKKLLEDGADPNICNLDLNTPLHTAVRLRDLDACKVLIQRGDASVDPKNKLGNTPLLISKSEEITSFLLLNGAHANAKNKNGETALYLAAFLGNVNMCKQLLDFGADPSLANREELTPLHIAAMKKNKDVCELLLNRGVSPNICMRRKITPLHMLCLERNGAEICSLLLDKGANRLARTSVGETPLSIAASSGNVKMCRVLKDDVLVADYYGNTPLHRSCMWGHAITSGYLISVGADVNAKNNVGFTPLHLAVLKNRVKVCKLLLENGADWRNARDSSLKTPFDWAINTSAEIAHLFTTH